MHRKRVGVAEDFRVVETSKRVYIRRQCSCRHWIKNILSRIVGEVSVMSASRGKNFGTKFKK